MSETDTVGAAHDAPDVLTVDDLHAGYGESPILNGVTIRLGVGEIVLLIGHNGSGKSTVLKSVLGLTRQYGGDIRFAGGSLRGRNVTGRVKDGIGYVPQALGVFPGFTVAHCLELGGYTLGRRRAIDRRRNEVLDLFPALAEHKDTVTGLLSGGEQRLVMLGMALMPQPSALLVDEPSAGLAPAKVTDVMNHLRTLPDATGVGVLLVEQNVTAGMSIADRLYVLREGVVAGEFTPDELASRDGFWDLL